jgi:tRNA1Val (adenine37-N6)-methyltransferase
MSKGSFRFKQFTIRQHLCAMKVGTDGVLLGAWADAPGCRYILDVGTGSGLIALMLAQRYSQAAVDAIDIDEGACRQAMENVEASPFADRVRVMHRSLSAYVQSTGRAYDLVVCNPPFFTQSLKSPDAGRNFARHADSLPLEELVKDAKCLLSPAGKLALILPSGRENELRAIAVSNSLNVVRATQVISKEGAEPKRLLAELSPDFSLPCRKDTLIIMSPSGYTQAYIQLTEEFYLRNT